MFTNTSLAADGHAGLDDIVLEAAQPSVPDAGSSLLLLGLSGLGLLAVARVSPLRVELKA